MTAYLDEAGLEELWSKVQGLVGGGSSKSLTTLFANQSGTSGTVTLSKSPSNYTCLLVVSRYYGNYSGYYIVHIVSTQLGTASFLFERVSDNRYYSTLSGSTILVRDSASVNLNTYYVYGIN